MKYAFTFLVALLPFLLQAQPPANAEEYEKQYQIRIAKKYLDGIYIPQDLEEAIKELNRLSESSGVESFKNMPEEVVVPKAHFGLGRWISNNWGFEFGSRYSHYLKTAGVSDPDDMIRITLTMWHRSLNSQDLNFETEALKIKEESMAAQEKRNASRDTVETQILTRQAPRN